MRERERRREREREGGVGRERERNHGAFLRNREKITSTFIEAIKISFKFASNCANGRF